MDCKTARHWHIVINGDNVPEDDLIVVGMWISGDEPWVELCHYEHEPQEWYSDDPNNRGNCLREPDYWIESPD